MKNFLICFTEQKIIIKTTEKKTVYTINAVNNSKKNKQQKQFETFQDYEFLRMFIVLDYFFSKSKPSIENQIKPKNVLMKNVFFSLKDVLVGSMGGAIGALLTPKFQEFGHYLELILSQLF